MVIASDPLKPPAFGALNREEHIIDTLATWKGQAVFAYEALAKCQLDRRL